MSKNKEYIEQYAEYAMEQMRKYGIPASVTLAQGICESASGQSELSRKGNNHFGIKATSSWIQEGGKYLVYTDDRPNEKFCQYANVGESYEHHSQFLKENKRYAELFKLYPDDYKGWTNGLQKAGYASSQQYANILQSIIEKNNLQKYDQLVMQEKQTQEKSNGLDTGGKTSSFPLNRNECMLVPSPFGTRKDPLNPSASQMHKGIDIQTNKEAVLATEDKGKVINVNTNANTAGGRSVTVEYDREDGSKYQCTYMHLDSVAVATGDEVMAGQKLGISGNTGTRTTGEHLHFGVKTIASDGTQRDIDPAAYLAEIAQKGNINLEALHNGQDITAQYKMNEATTNQGVMNDVPLTADGWMKKLLSSEDSGVNMSTGDPIVELVMTMFTSLMALALQIDQRSEQEKMNAVTQAAITKKIDLSSLLPAYKECSIGIQNGKPYLQVNTGKIELHRELSNAEVAKIQQTLGNSNLTDDDKKRSIASVINAAVVSHQMSQNYQNGIDVQQNRQESVQLK